jgi:phage terminase large subunit GpA-like protein
MLEFAKQDIILPDGPFADTNYDPKLLPYSEAFLNEVDSGAYSSFAVMGPSQAGKTFTGILIPLSYHLFEEREYTMLGLPSGAMFRDKLSRDILPVISKSKYVRYLPLHGQGSKGGLTDVYQFTNGSVLRGLTAGGNEKSRAGLTGRILICDEIDGYASDTGNSEETDKLSQMIARTRAYISTRQIYMASTPTTPTGRINVEVNTHGTGSRLLVRCQHCDTYVLPERNHLQGWQDASCEDQAREQATMVCPVCGVCWTENDRVRAVRDYKLEHTRQSRQLGFQFTAVHNLLYSIEDLAAEEYKASKRPDKQIAEREMCQFIWGIPYTPPDIEDSIDIESLQYKISNVVPRSMIPTDFDFVTCGIDVQKRCLYYTVVAWKKDLTSHTLDYGIVDVNTDEFGIERALKTAFNELNDRYACGYIREGTSELEFPSGVGADCGYETMFVYKLCKELNWIPCKGLGEIKKGRYNQPAGTNHRIVWIGDNQHFVSTPNGVLCLERDANYEKSRLLDLQNIPKGQPGYWSIFSGSKVEHLKFFKHMGAEQLVEKDGVYEWVRLSSSNHFRDAWLNAFSVARMLIEREEQANQQSKLIVKD